MAFALRLPAQPGERGRGHAALVQRLQAQLLREVVDGLVVLRVARADDERDVRVRHRRRPRVDVDDAPWLHVQRVRQLEPDGLVERRRHRRARGRVLVKDAEFEVDDQVVLRARDGTTILESARDLAHGLAPRAAAWSPICYGFSLKPPESTHKRLGAMS